MLEKALRGKRKPGRKGKKDDDEISDEELARELEGWVEVRWINTIPRYLVLISD